MVTGSEILANPGNPNLAAGSGYGGDTAPVIDQTPINNTFNRILQDNATWNHMQYQQKMNDRNAMYKLLQQGLDLGFAPLPEDKKRLEDNGTALADYVKKNPGFWNDPNKYTDFIGKFSQNNNQQSVAKLRAAQAALQQQEIAKETNPDIRQKRIDYLEGQLKDPDHVPVPYQPMLTANFDYKYPEEIAIGQPNRYKDANGVAMKDQVYQTPIEALPTPEQYIPGTQQYWQANANRDAFMNSPAMMEDKHINLLNAEIERKNKDRGITPNDPTWVPPIATKDANNQWQINPDLATFDRSLRYSNPSFKVYTRKGEIDKDYGGLLNQNTRTEIAGEKEQRLLDKQKYGKGQYAGDNVHVNKVIDDISTLTTEAADAKTNINQPIFKTFDEEGKAIIRDGLKKAGFKTGENVYELSAHDPRVEAMVSTYENGIKNSPDVTYMITPADGNPDHARLLSFTIPKNKKGKTDGAPEFFSIVDPRQGAVNEFNYNTPNKTTNAQMIKEHENIYNAFDKRKQKGTTSSVNTNVLPSSNNYVEAMSKIAKDNGFTITSTTGGEHNVDSPHYKGNAIDIRVRDKKDSDIDAIKSTYEKAGYIVRDERKKPTGQKVWGGPHLHIETTPIINSEKIDDVQEMDGTVYVQMGKDWKPVIK